MYSSVITCIHLDNNLMIASLPSRWSSHFLTPIPPSVRSSWPPT
jgi:hypothetical protein